MLTQRSRAYGPVLSLFQLGDRLGDPRVVRRRGTVAETSALLCFPSRQQSRADQRSQNQRRGTTRAGTSFWPPRESRFLVRSWYRYRRLFALSHIGAWRVRPCSCREKGTLTHGARDKQATHTLQEKRRSSYSLVPLLVRGLSLPPRYTTAEP